MRNFELDMIREIIAEEKNMLDEHVRFNNIILKEHARLKSLGSDRLTINEGLLDIISQLGSSFIKRWKKQFALNMLSKLGLHPQGFLADAIAEVFENMSVMDFRRYLGPEGCDDLTDLILVALLETSTNPIVDGVMANLGVNPTTALYGTIKDAIETTLQQGDLFQSLSRKLAEFVCGIDVGDAVAAFTGSVGAGDIDLGSQPRVNRLGISPGRGPVSDIPE